MTQHSNSEDGKSTDRNGDSGGIGRRHVLRRGATALAAGFGGLAVTARTATATACPRMPAEWRSSPDEWPSFSEEASLLLLDESGDEQWAHPNEEQDRILEELSKPAGDDVYLRLVKQYVAARLNRRGIRPHPDGYDDYWDRIAAYNRWIRGADRPQREWTVEGVDGLALYDYFNRWNSGLGWGCGRMRFGTEFVRIRPY